MLIARLADAGVVVRADRLEYNLTALSVSLSGVTVAAAGTTETPFFAAKEVAATLPWAILSGRFTIDRIEVVSPSVTLRRDAAGRDNWTIAPSDRSSASPPSLQIRRLIVRDLSLDFTDEQQAAHVDAALSVDLTAHGAATRGPIAMSRPAAVRFRDRSTSISSSGGILSWNDRDLSIQGLSLNAAEGTVRLDARVQELLGTPRVDVTIDADANLEALSPWARLARALPGAAHVTARIADSTVDLTNISARIAGGEITGKGHASFGGQGALRLAWRQIDLAALLGQVLANAPRVLPASTAAGTLDARWRAPTAHALPLTATAGPAGRAA